MWKDELVEILFSNDPSKINVKKAISLKYENTPSSLYKYKSFDDEGYSLNLLKTDKMYLSRPNEFNDPFDSAYKLVSSELPDDVIKVIAEGVFNDVKEKFGCSNKELSKLKRSNNIVDDLAKFVVKHSRPNISLEERAKFIEEEKRVFKEDYNLDIGLRNSIHVACFSETHNSILMWSHYTKNHEGFCVQYNFKKLGLNNFYTRFILPVIYKDNIFDMKDYLPGSKKEFINVIENYVEGIKIENFLGEIPIPEVFEGNMNNMLLFYNALVKSVDWIYENEWRYVVPYKNTENKRYYLPVPKPKAIYLGAKISKENCEKILKIAKERNINVYKMEIKPNEFALESILIYESEK